MPNTANQRSQNLDKGTSETAGTRRLHIVLDKNEYDLVVQRAREETSRLRRSGGRSVHAMSDVIRDAVRYYIREVRIPVFRQASCGLGRRLNPEYSEESEPEYRITTIAELTGLDPDSAPSLFVVRAEGNSMNSTVPSNDIQQGDLVVFQLTSAARNGQIVYVQTTDGANGRKNCIKTYVPLPDGSAMLRSSNMAMSIDNGQRLYPDIRFTGEEEAIILGVWTGLLIRGARM